LRIFKTGHNPFRKILFLIQALYNFVAFILSWFNLSAFLLMTFVVTNLTGSPPTGSKSKPWPFRNATPVFNAILQIFYIAIIIWQLLLALGNRPKGERRSYVISFYIFGFIQLYFIMNVLYLVKVIIQDKTSASNASSYSYITTFYTEIGQLTVWITCASVFGVYYAAAFLNFDPWHMFIAYPQYLLVASVYTNIVNIYAFCNYNDISWGTKTPSRASDALSSARIVKLDDKHQFIEEPVLPQADIDSQFEYTVKRALKPYVPPKPDTEKSLKESYDAFRTKLVAAYIFSNFLVCIIVMNDSFDKLKFLVYLSNLSLSFE
jgi:chitin synthase